MALRRLQRAKKVEDMPMTKRRTTQTPQGNLSKQGQEWLAEIDWDLLDQLEMEEEGQPIPMQDYQPQDQSSPTLSREPIQDPARGVLLRAMEKDASQEAPPGNTKVK